MRRKILRINLSYLKFPKLQLLRSKTKIVTCPRHVGNSLLSSINKKYAGKCNSQPHRCPSQMSQGWDMVAKPMAQLDFPLVKIGHGSSSPRHGQRDESHKF